MSAPQPIKVASWAGILQNPSLSLVSEPNNGLTFEIQKQQQQKPLEGKQAICSCFSSQGKLS